MKYIMYLLLGAISGIVFNSIIWNMKEGHTNKNNIKLLKKKVLIVRVLQFLFICVGAWIINNIL